MAGKRFVRQVSFPKLPPTATFLSAICRLRVSNSPGPFPLVSLSKMSPFCTQTFEPY
jgi:hypothetical protein